MTTIILTEAECRRAMRQAIFCQCFGLLGMALFTSNVVLLYLLAMGIGEAQTLLYLAFPNVISAFLLVPMAHISDRIGIKRMGNIGVLVNSVGILVIAAAGSFANPVVKEIYSAAGIIIYGIGMTVFGSVWVPLLQPIIPESVRGRFFGLLRLSWQGVSLGASAIIALLLSLWQGLFLFQIIIAVTAGLTLFRGVFYRAIPELTAPSVEGERLSAALVHLGGYREYVAFGSYIFLLIMFAYTCPSLFALVEKTALNLNQSTIVMLSNAGMIGAMLGCWLGGVTVDRFGTKHVFLVCHFSFGLILSLFVLRGLFPGPALIVLLYALHFLFGVVVSASGIAIISESMALIPTRYCTIAWALLNTVISIGLSMSGFFCSGALKTGFLMKEWIWFGMKLCDVDALILVCDFMIVILVVTLGLVPSVFRKTDLGNAG